MSDILTDHEKYNRFIIETVYRTSKKTVQEYVKEVERHCRFKSMQHMSQDGTVLDDRSKLIDLYDACVQQDAHLAAVLETLFSQIIGERYMLARENEKGRYEKDVKATKKVQGIQFIKIIKAIAESVLFGYSGIEILPTIDSSTGKLKEVNQIERRNILPYQRRIVRRQGMWSDGWNFDDPKYADNYILIDSGNIGLFSATTPLILAKKFTLANYVNFSHTYGQPIIHGKSSADNHVDRQRLANEIASAAQNKVLVTGADDSIDIKTFTMSNSERIFTGLIEIADKDVANLILGSQSMAGENQAYVGSASAHQDIFRDRVAVYREYVENVMNEEVLPRLVKMGYIDSGLEFKYSRKMEMSIKDQIALFNFLSSTYEISSEEIEKTFGVAVGKQLNVLEVESQMAMLGGESVVLGGEEVVDDGIHNGKRPMSDMEYFKRYGRHKGSGKPNFQTEGE